MTLYYITIAALALLAAVSGVLALICQVRDSRATRRVLREFDRKYLKK